MHVADSVARRGCNGIGADGGAPTLNERLGYPADAKLVILSCDDLGSCHAANVGVYQASARARPRARR